MSKPSLIRIWVSAARLRTLPLSMAGIITGNALAAQRPFLSWVLFGSTLLTAISLQILSNFANDYGDGIKGTDNENRIGPKRVLQQKLLSTATLFRGIVVTAIISMGMAVTTIFLAFGDSEITSSLVFFGLGLGAIAAAYKYTAGKRAYGYRALGDVFVFMFFGLLAVCGSYFLQTKEFNTAVWWFALTMGCLSVGVLNLNNMRDIENDTAVGKKTVAAILGIVLAKNYQGILMLISCTSLTLGVVEIAQNRWHFLPLFALMPLGIHVLKMFRIKDHADFDNLLKPLALTTFLISLILFATQHLF